VSNWFFGSLDFLLASFVDASFTLSSFCNLWSSIWFDFLQILLII
jgi:hypothetical protein